ncbi:preprotein translocase subunit SecE [Clostridium thermosuccinogenes]|jgi:preprotein translocase subunit SecE|uniref:Protein translocase subunit SecE n=1 Tax=Clostridium thermosuccinogenes TaxID=84032 RepID=A0A2K2F5C3_9CLOT|nr:preprotein translocase subunit SecE [Pseudoclostridium thermosuccinogenes]AUS97736.1 preprotein translocase subunit SecE [Pseudoclostridium thermosuccinogenes]PNT93978.1 preprotein translocase subunit SecE [Pseudoclostridium thermosuccinogenes]PNT98100.1 preprotein translocase subunit SecE [Pseudoclostridium thermosuccinogenes]PNU00071.1 preprotein translocase subunit SecE [Pseudoclostridium thermosuccinogenes]
MADNVKVSKLAKARKGFVKFFREVRLELKKVIWLSRNQLIKNTATVIGFCLFFGIIIWVVDAGLSKLIEVTLMR